MRVVGTLVWAVDAFHAKPKAQLRVLDAVRRLWGDDPPSILPVALLPTGKYDAKQTRFLESWEELSAAARANLHAMLSRVTLPTLRAPRLEPAESDSMTETARNLIEIALDENAEMIAVSSHARHGLARLLAGSFAETLASHSPLPVLVVNPRNGRGGDIRTVLFPTDFSPSSRKIFEEAVRFAASLGARLRIFHKVPYYYPGVAYPLFVMPLPPVESPAEIRARVREEARSWLDYAHDYGVRAILHLDTKPGDELDALIAVARRTGAGTVLATGPTAPILRLSPCPVIVLHGEEERAKLASKARRHGKELGFGVSAWAELG